MSYHKEIIETKFNNISDKIDNIENFLFDINKLSYVKHYKRPSGYGYDYNYEYRTWLDFKLPSNIIKEMKECIKISEKKKNRNWIYYMLRYKK